MQDHRKLRVWTLAHSVAVDLSTHAAATRRGDVRPLLHRAAQAAQYAPAHIAAGCASESPATMAQYLGHAITSSNEALAYVRLGCDIDRASPQHRTELATTLDRLCRMLATLRTRVRAQESADQRQPQPPRHSRTHTIHHPPTLSAPLQTPPTTNE